MKKHLALLISLIFLWGSVSFAGKADVVRVKVTKDNNNLYSFAVTVSHNDTGWEHYANKWDIVAPKGTVLGTRVLHHPHVEEQPFTRSLSGIEIPEHIKTVTVRAHDSDHEYGGKVMSIDLP